jgi:hypothetical protein
MHALRRILRYIQGTPKYGLHLYPSSTFYLVSYTYTDLGGCPDTIRSTSGYCLLLGVNILSWSSKRNLLLELHCPILKATLVYYENVSAIYISGNPVQLQPMKMKTGIYYISILG